MYKMSKPYKRNTLSLRKRHKKKAIIYFDNDSMSSDTSADTSSACEDDHQAAEPEVIGPDISCRLWNYPLLKPQLNEEDRLLSMEYEFIDDFAQLVQLKYIPGEDKEIASDHEVSSSHSADQASEGSPTAKVLSSESTLEIGLILSKGDFRRFLERVPITSWNERLNAQKIYNLFNASLWIVHPNLFLSERHDSTSERMKFSRILDTLERDDPSHPHGTPWSQMKAAVDEFLEIFDDDTVARLPLVLGDKKKALPLAEKLMDRIITAQKFCKLVVRDDYTYIKLLAQAIIDDCLNPGGAVLISEEFYERHVAALIGFMTKRLGQDLGIDRQKKLFLALPTYKMYTKRECAVIPDILVRSSRTEEIVLVCEVKQFCSHVGSFENPSTMPMKTSDEPHPGTCAGNEVATEKYNKEDKTGSKEQMKKKRRRVSTDSEEGETMSEASEQTNEEPCFVKRRLDTAEKFLVSCYLPELLGQMLTALQMGQPCPNRSATSRTCNALGSSKESVQLGIGVEGLKLRLVKMVLRHYPSTRSFIPPYIAEMLEGHGVACDVFITEEFNLLQRTHVKMFLEAVLAIAAVTRGML